ncbi:hypothetical protein ACFY4C_40125 [Actinomadura viridis]|uniref:hypothetical protein n=1 Tax=Actinomadura viridis TaxID=58110 RepID=UPI00369CE43C
MSRDERIEYPDLAGYARANADDVYRMLTGADPNDLREMVRIVGGNRAAAALTGRSVRTVERWVTKTGTQRISRPRADALQALRTQAQQIRVSQAGRRQILTGRREQNLRRQGMRLRGRAYAGPLIADVEYRRRRYFDHPVPGRVMDRTIDAYLAGGEEDAYSAFNAAFGQEYQLTGFDPEEGGWIIEDMSGLEFSVRRGED